MKVVDSKYASFRICPQSAVSAGIAQGLRESFPPAGGPLPDNLQVLLDRLGDSFRAEPADR